MPRTGVVLLLSSRTRRDSLHEKRRLAWERHHGFTVPCGLVFRQRCQHEDCTEPEHLFLSEVVPGEPQLRQRRWANANSVGPSTWNSGEDNPKARLTRERVARIRQRHSEGSSLAVLALEYGVSVSWLKRLVRGEGWRSAS